MRVIMLFLAVLAGFPAGVAQAQRDAASGYPASPVRIVVPFAAGGSTDIVARLLAQKLYELWGQSVIVDDRGGASGNVGAELVAGAASDGYTLLMTSGSIVTANEHIYNHKKMTFDPDTALTPITKVASGPQILVVNASAPWNSVKDLIAAAKARPKSITFGSAGFGTQMHLAAESFIYAAGIDVGHVPYKGETPALIDLIARQVDFAMPNLSAAVGYVTQGKLHGLGVTSRSRVRRLPDVPAIAETLPGFENLGWFGLMAPAGTPRAVIEKVGEDTAKVLKAPKIRSRLEQLGMAATPNSAEQFAKAIKAESARWAKIVRERKLVIHESDGAP